MKISIGVDPGQGGGLAIISELGLIEAVKMPETEKDLLDLLGTWRACYEHQGEVKAVLEFVRSSPQMGVVSAFKFGVGYGGLRMALVACEIPFDEVVPAKWQRVLGCRSGGDKNVTKRRAQELFPAAKVTHAVADAMLLAEYGKRVALGQVA